MNPTEGQLQRGMLAIAATLAIALPWALWPTTPPYMRCVMGSLVLIKGPGPVLILYGHLQRDVPPPPGGPIRHTKGSWPRQALVVGTMLSMAGACGLMLVAAICFEGPQEGKAWFFGLTGTPIFLTFAIRLGLAAAKPWPGLHADDQGLHILAEDTRLAWRDIASIAEDKLTFSIPPPLLVTLRSGEVRRVKMAGAPASRHTLPALLAYAGERITETTAAPSRAGDPVARPGPAAAAGSAG